MFVEERDMENQLNRWLQGIYSEIGFWDRYIREKGGVWKDGWEQATVKNRVFELEDDIPEDKIGQEYDFVDIGSGPFSRVGIATDKVKLNHCAVDPLAEVYKSLKKRNNLENGINLRTGFVELLDKEFSANSFDLIHMSNSLDHSFDALLGIYQLINICRIGGKIILRHRLDEAVYEKYEGFHQWNLYVDIESNIFMLWRADEKYIINDLFSEYVDIKCMKDPIEEIFYRVELVKKKDIQIPPNDMYDRMLSKIYEFMLSVIAHDVYKNVNSPKELFIEENIQRLESYTEKEMGETLHKKEFKKVALYGMGRLGKKLYDCIIETGVEITLLLDERELTYKSHKTVKVADCNNWDIDAVIVTVFSGFDQICKDIKDSGFNGQILSIDAVMD